MGERASEERDVGVDALDVSLGFFQVLGCAPRMHVTMLISQK